MASKTLTYTLVRSNRKTLGITIERNNDIIVRAPQDCPIDVIDDFFEGKKFWIYQKMAEKRLIEDELPPKKYVNGEGFLYLGKSYRLQIVDDGVPLKLSHGYFELNQKYADKGRETFTKWYREHALPIIEKRVDIYKSILGVEPSDIRVLDLKFRWGSCSSAGTINIHWKTILAPMPIVDYVVVHELVHLKEKNHTQRFWDIMGSVLADYEKRKEWLKVNGNYFEI